MSLILDGTNGVSDIDGSAATPAIRGTDANTGMFFPAADTIAFSEGGVESMRLNSSGVLVTTNDASISGLTVGKGAGSVATNVVVGGNGSLGGGSQTGTNNTALGDRTLTANTSGSYNTAVGQGAVYLNTTGSNNSGLGSGALQSNTTGSANTALGVTALYSNTTASNNTAVGYQSLYANTTGGPNDAFGFQSLKANTTGNYNVAYGTASLTANTTGSSNTAMGNYALQANTTASNNTAVGYQAGYTQAGGVGANTFFGTQAGYNVTVGNTNTFVGFGAGGVVSSGSNNTIIGGYNGNQGGLDIRTASNYIVLSDGAGNPRAWIGAGNNNDLFRVGTTSTATPSWMHQISYSQTSRAVIGITNDVSGGNPNGISIQYPNSSNATSNDHYLYCYNSTGLRFGAKNDGGISNYSANNVNLSDRREKEDFSEAGNYLDKICAIPIQTFRYIDRDENDTALTLGVVAQDVQAVAPELVTESNWGNKDEPEKLRLSIYQTDLQYALMKSIQELNAKLEAQALEIAQLKGQ